MSSYRRLDALEGRVRRLQVPRQTREDYALYQNDPVAFRERVLGFPSATRRSDAGAYQDEALAAVATEPRVALQAGHGVGVPATEPDRIEGLHSEGGLLLIMDESKGIPQAVFDALQGALTGGDDSRLVVASTPGGASGPFYRACTSRNWRVLQMSAEDSSLVSPQWVQDRKDEWGEESPLYQSRVRGLFADAGEGQLFPLALLESAAERKVEPGEVVLGVDVARSLAGDKNAIAVSRGGVLERVMLFHSPDLMMTAQRVASEALLVRPTLIRVDAGGLSGLGDRLKQLGFNVEDVHFGGGASEPNRWKNRRAEMYWSLRQRLDRAEIQLPDDDELFADLTAMRYGFDQQGRVTLEPKDAIRAKLGHSPDRADAVALALSAGRQLAGIGTCRIQQG